MSKKIYTTSNGCPVFDPLASQRIGKNGPLLLQDFNLIDLLAHFDRERIPERVVHAKGSGAFGKFVLTDPIDDLTCADFLTGPVNKVTNCFVRFSTVGGEKGSADGARDPRGFGIKFYTNEGNCDWVCNNTPVFFLRDPAKFPVFIHTQKRNPETNLKDANMFWDYLSTNQESAHQVMILFSDRGTPYGYRHMNGYSGHTLKFVKKNGDFVYVQIHFKTNQGIKNLTNEQSNNMDPDYAQKDLYDSIKAGKFPSWTVYIQTMTCKQAEDISSSFSIFDLTKVWPQSLYPLRKIGILTLDKNPENYFAQVEQAAFSPSHLVPGIEPSADPVLQARLFSYPDTQRHRLGVNYQQIPVNCPFHSYTPFHRDGSMVVDGNKGSAPNYPATLEAVNNKNDVIKYPSSNDLSMNTIPQHSHEEWTGKALAYQWKISQDDSDDTDFVQPRALWKILCKQPGQAENFVHNVATHLSGAKKKIRERTYGMFTRIDPVLGARIKQDTEREVTKSKL